MTEAEKEIKEAFDSGYYRGRLDVESEKVRELWDRAQELRCERYADTPELDSIIHMMQRLWPELEGPERQERQEQEEQAHEEG